MIPQKNRVFIKILALMQNMSNKLVKASLEDDHDFFFELIV